MAIRIKVSSNVKAYADTTEADCLFGLGNDNMEFNIDNMEECNSGKLRIDASGTLSLPLGAVGTPKGCLIKSDQDLDIVISGGAQTLELRKHSAGTSDAPTFVPFLFMGNFSSLSMENQSATAKANVHFIVFGDPTV